MAFECLEVAHEAVRALREVIDEIARRDPAQADQVRRALHSVVHNLAEGRYRAGRDRPHAYRVAAGSAAEVVAGVRIAVDWAHVDAARAAPGLALLDRVLAMCWRLTH